MYSTSYHYKLPLPSMNSPWTRTCCLQRYTCPYALRWIIPTTHNNVIFTVICPTLIVSSTSSTPITQITPGDPCPAPPRSLTGDTRTRISWLPVSPTVCLSVWLSLISVSHSWRHSRMPLIQLMGRLSQLYLCHLILPPPTPLTTQQLTPKLTLVLYPCLQTRSVFAVLSRICIFWFTDHFVLTLSQALLILWAFKIRVMLLGSLVSQVTPFVPKI